MGSEASASLPNKPQAKMAPIAKGARIHKRPLPGPSPLRQIQTATHPDELLPKREPEPDQDGYLPPPRAPRTVVIYVSSKSPFMAIVSRVRKALDRRNGGSLRSTKGLPLAQRVQALEVGRSSSSGQDHARATADDAPDDVLVIGTGRAIQKALEVGAYFMRERNLVVCPRTRTLHAIDDIRMLDADEEDRTRVRNLSCLEVGIRRKT